MAMDTTDSLSEYYTEIIFADTQWLGLPEDKSIVEKERVQRRKIKD